MHQRSKSITPEQWRDFFFALSLSGNVSRACVAGNISRATAYHYKQTNTVIAERWEEALTRAYDKLEQTAWDRAVEGVVVSVEPILYHGKEVAQKITKKYSDSLLNQLLAANRPEKFRQAIDVNVNWRGKLEQMQVDPDAMLHALVEQARQKLLETSNSDVIEGEVTDMSWLDSPTENTE